MKKISSFFYQSGVLIERCFKILLNDKKQLILNILVPLMTILIVCFVACDDMYSMTPKKDHTINDGNPVLNWETVVQEKESDDDKDETELIQPEEATVSNWDGESTEIPSSPTKVDGENYFIITNAKQLAFLSEAVDNGYDEYLTYNYILQSDINLKSHKFTPIGTKKVPFTGTFDGNGHIISNLKIDSSADNVGLFGCVKSNAKAKSDVEVEQAMYGTTLDMVFYHNGIVKNLQVENANIKTKGESAGIIAGLVQGKSRITSVSAKNGTVYSEKGVVGGLIGTVDSEDVEIYIAYSTAKVKTKGENAGGLVGKLGEGRLSAAYASCEVVYTGDDEEKNIGAIAGNCNEPAEQCKNVFYDNQINDIYKGIKEKDYDNAVVGVSTTQLAKLSSFLVPYKDIMTDYELNHLSEEDQDRYDQDDYDVEEDADIDDTYGFKKDGQMAVFGGTQTGLFMLVCVAIFVGICNSIQEICKERSILKREYMTNLNLGSYVISKLFVQAVICAVQMLVVILIFAMFVRDKELPTSGAIFGSIWIEYFITMFLLAFAADTLALLISSLVKSSELASTFIPIVLIVQIVFSGVLFEMSGFFELAANFMISKWGINALAATTSLNDSQAIFMIENPELQLQLGNSLATVKPEYASTATNLLMVWGILLAFVVVSSVVCGVLLRRVKHDRR